MCCEGASHSSLVLCGQEFIYGEVYSLGSVHYESDHYIYHGSCTCRHVDVVGIELRHVICDVLTVADFKPECSIWCLLVIGYQHTDRQGRYSNHNLHI